MYVLKFNNFLIVVRKYFTWLQQQCDCPIPPIHQSCVDFTIVTHLSSGRTTKVHNQNHSSQETALNSQCIVFLKFFNIYCKRGSERDFWFAIASAGSFAPVPLLCCACILPFQMPQLLSRAALRGDRINPNHYRPLTQRALHLLINNEKW